jgi:hypothetical protein
MTGIASGDNPEASVSWFSFIEKTKGGLLTKV